MSKATKFNVLGTADMDPKEYLDAPEGTQNLTLALALVEAAKSTERLYREKPERFSAQLSELRDIGIEEPSIPFVLGFCAGGALMIDFLEKGKEAERRRSLFTVPKGGRA